MECYSFVASHTFKKIFTTPLEHMCALLNIIVKLKKTQFYLTSAQNVWSELVDQQ